MNTTVVQRQVVFLLSRDEIGKPSLVLVTLEAIGRQMLPVEAVACKLVLELRKLVPTSVGTCSTVHVLILFMIALVGLVGNRKLVHHAHDDDAVGVRLWRTFFSKGVVCRGNVLFYCLQQMHRGLFWIDVEFVIEELRISSVRRCGSAISPIICPLRRKCGCRAHRACSRHNIESETHTWTFA